MHFDLNFGQPPLEIGLIASQASDRGFDGIWIGETHSDPFISSHAAICSSERILVGTSVAIAFARTPMLLAYTGWDLSRISEGRFVLGLGSQVKAHIERRFSMPWSAPAARMREYVQALRAIWQCWAADEPLLFEGDFYRHSLMPPVFRPSRHEFGPPRVYLAAVGEAMTAVAGEVADGLLLHPFTTRAFFDQSTVPSLERGRLPSTSSRPERPSIVGSIFSAIGRDEAEIVSATEACRRQLAFYASTPQYRSVLAVHGWEDLQPELTKLSKEGAWERMADAVDDRILEEFVLAGRPEQVVDQLADRWGDALDRVSLYTPYDVDPELLEEASKAYRAKRE